MFSPSSALVRCLRALASRLAATGNGPFWLLLGITLGCAAVVLRPPPPVPALLPLSETPDRGVRPADRCPVPTERPDEGVVCLDPAEAARLGLAAGDVWPLGPHHERVSGPPRRMAPERLLAAGVPLDPQTASTAELEALPDLGPALARRLVEARATTPLSSRAALLAIPGIGPHRLARLLPFLIPLP